MKVGGSAASRSTTGVVARGQVHGRAACSSVLQDVRRIARRTRARGRSRRRRGRGRSAAARPPRVRAPARARRACAPASGPLLPDLELADLPQHVAGDVLDEQPVAVAAPGRCSSRSRPACRARRRRAGRGRPRSRAAGRAGSSGLARAARPSCRQARLRSLNISRSRVPSASVTSSSSSAKLVRYAHGRRSRPSIDTGAPLRSPSAASSAARSSAVLDVASSRHAAHPLEQPRQHLVASRSAPRRSRAQRRHGARSRARPPRSPASASSSPVNASSPSPVGRNRLKPVSCATHRPAGGQVAGAAIAEPAAARQHVAALGDAELGPRAGDERAVGVRGRRRRRRGRASCQPLRSSASRSGVSPGWMSSAEQEAARRCARRGRMQLAHRVRLLAVVHALVLDRAVAAPVADRREALAPGRVARAASARARPAARSGSSRARRSARGTPGVPIACPTVTKWVWPPKRMSMPCACQSWLKAGSRSR